ncbi:eIF2A-related protein [Rivularia sp. UHCC 0363]|uniref:nSTAND1 domain-containing NTPase n=1 Tax=Rivularia sp. UHCC 0363 TaxID=3110244 RepID=UPI002B2073EC|nr:CHAT domain-containing protein [Rivularia sp. UHCC 0363]MEA5595078.1 CHAT domain-containing protein [Rivularia sp. UHCC 0363]
MSKLVVINLGNGELEKGFEQVTARLWEVGNSLPEQFIGSLPPAPELAQLYRNWRLNYQSLFDLRLRTRTFYEDDEIEIEVTGITNVSSIDFNNLSTGLQQYLNNWLKSVEFLNIDRKLRSALNSTEEIRIILETNHALLRRLPWYCWDFFDDYPKAAMALSQLEYQRIASSRQPKFPRDKVRILAVLGNSKNIDLEAEARFLESLQDAQVEFLVKPSRNTFNNYLWDSKGWDILFFAGHSKTEEETGRIYINENNTDNSLTIEQLKEALKQAIEKGLKLAIFNSCDGLGLADELQRLHIPTVIVMREPVPNLVAQKFFEYFLDYFAIEQLPLYLSVKQARKRLQGLENEFPAASWLPIICQNPGVAPPVWLDLGRHPTKISPYRGLFAFREEDARFFFGRETFTQMLVNAVQNQPFVAVVGSSGSGKSSVVFAGLVKRLRDTGEWFIIDFRPGERPLFNLATAIISQQEDNLSRTERLRDIRNFTTDLQHCENGLRDLVDNILSENPNGCFLLVADQFEELYTLCRDSQERKAFLDRLLEAISHSHRFTLVITLRADFLGQALSYRPFADVLQYADLKLGPMTYSELQATIEKPVELLGVTIEDKLTERILSELNPGNLPLLEFALTQLWAKQQDAQLTHAAYNEIGAVEAALACYASEAYNQLNFEEKERAQRIFIQLVHPGFGTEDTRRVATLKEIGAENWNLVTRLADARLVVTGYDEKTNLETVEIVHEALIRNWGQLREWMHQDRDFRYWQEQLRVAMLTWESSGCDEGALLRGKPLTDAQDWQNQRFLELSSVERSFIRLSVKFRERESKNKKRRRRFTIYGLSVGLVLALSLAGLAWWQWRNSVKNEIKALSASSEAYLSSNRELDALIAAIRTKRKSQNLTWISTDIKNEATKNLERAVYSVVEYNRLSGHEKVIWAVVFSPDGKTIASASADGTIKLWNRNGKELNTFKGHNNEIWAVAFSPDSKTIASASVDGTIKLWNQNGKELNTLKGHSDKVYSVQFSPDGKTIASASADGTIKLWNQNGKELNTFKGHNNEIWAVAFSPDGKMIASASGDGTIKLWNQNGKKLNTLKGHEDKVYSVQFSPDGQKIASASGDKTVKIWNVYGGELNTFRGHSDKVWQVVFSPDGTKIASASWDSTVNIWNHDGKLLKTLEGHSDRVRGVAFSPDSKTIASASEDKTVKLWKLNNGLFQVLKNHNKAVIGVRFSPDGKTIASASDDTTIKIWNQDGSLLSTLEGHDAGVLGVDFSPDGKIIASASDDKTIKLWKSNGTWLRDFKGHNKGVWGVAFSPDGQKIASASMDSTIKIWDINGKLLKTLQGHSNEVRKVIFSPDGKTIASASLDETVKLWKVDGTLLHTLPHKDSVFAVSFSPDGKTIASGGLDNSIKLWKVKGQFVKNFKADSDGVRGISFSPDGKIIASAGGDNNIKLWNSNGILLATLRGHEQGLREVSFSPDGNTIASAGEDKIVILWDNNQSALIDPLIPGCKWVQDYLKNSASFDKSDRNLCN